MVYRRRSTGPGYHHHQGTSSLHQGTTTRVPPPYTRYNPRAEDQAVFPEDSSTRESNQAVFPGGSSTRARVTRLSFLGRSNQESVTFTHFRAGIWPETRLRHPFHCWSCPDSCQKVRKERKRAKRPFRHFVHFGEKRQNGHFVTFWSFWMKQTGLVLGHTPEESESLAGF